MQQAARRNDGRSIARSILFGMCPKQPLRKVRETHACHGQPWNMVPRMCFSALQRWLWRTTPQHQTQQVPCQKFARLDMSTLLRGAAAKAKPQQKIAKPGRFHGKYAGNVQTGQDFASQRRATRRPRFATVAAAGHSTGGPSDDQPKLLPQKTSKKIS